MVMATIQDKIANYVKNRYPDCYVEDMSIRCNEPGLPITIGIGAYPFMLLYCSKFVLSLFEYEKIPKNNITGNITYNTDIMGGRDQLYYKDFKQKELFEKIDYVCKYNLKKMKEIRELIKLETIKKMVE